MSIFDSYMPHNCTITTHGDPNPADDGETRIHQVTSSSRCHFIAENQLYLKLDGTHALSKALLLLPSTTPPPDPTSIITIFGQTYHPHQAEGTSTPWGHPALQIFYLE